MKCAADCITRGENVIELGERIYRLLLALVERKRQRAIRPLLKVVFETFREIKLVCYQRAVEGHSRRSLAQTAKVPAENPKFGQRIIELEVPLVTAALRLDRPNSRGEASELSRIRCLECLYW